MPASPKTTASAPFEILVKRTTPAGLPDGMQWIRHDGAKATARRQRQLIAQERRATLRLAKAHGIDITFDDEPERAQ